MVPPIPPINSLKTVLQKVTDVLSILFTVYGFNIKGRTVSVILVHQLLTHELLNPRPLQQLICI